MRSRGYYGTKADLLEACVDFIAGKDERSVPDNVNVLGNRSDELYDAILEVSGEVLEESVPDRQKFPPNELTSSGRRR